MTADILPLRDPPPARAIHITVPGAPIGKGRPRFVRATGRTYTPERTARYENLIALYGAEAMRGMTPISVAVSVLIVAFMPVAASWSKRKRADALAGILRPGKPDVDNILKACSDGLNGVVWADDRQIARATIEKRYEERPRLEITVTPL